jgi:hypothetical protein
MKTVLLFLMLTAFCVINGCTPKYSVTAAGPRGTSVDAELIIYELVIRNLAKDEPRGGTVFVSFGESVTDHVAPPEKFFRRLADVGVSLKPASPRDQFAKSNALLFVVHLIEWKSKTEATVSVRRVRFGVGASDGFTATTKWSEGVWKLAATKGHWST